VKKEEKENGQGVGLSVLFCVEREVQARPEISGQACPIAIFSEEAGGENRWT
jgi:hypothetical protein